MNTYNQTWDKVLSQKLNHYKAVGKHILANNKRTITTAFALGAMVVAPEALAAQGVTSEVNFKSLADEGIDSIKNAGKAAMGVFGIGITIVGAFKGYSVLKAGIRRA